VGETKNGILLFILLTLYSVHEEGRKGKRKEKRGRGKIKSIR
jgi:hypothetical protein